MAEITHRQMRNDSAEVLRRVADGETIVVTNNGRPAAVIAPPTTDAITLLETQGQVRAPIVAPTTLRSIQRRPPTRTTAALIDDSRGRW